MKRVVKFGFWLIFIYQKYISPAIPARCRYYPTCSAYAKDALRWHDERGFFLIFKRIIRCHPFGGSGVDFVPVPLYRYTYTPSKTAHCVVKVATMDYGARLAWLLKHRKPCF